MHGCQRGGRLREARLDRFDFSAYAGFPVTLADVPGLRCDRCGYATPTGKAISAATVQVALRILKQPARLRGVHARYLRKLLEVSQGDLAARMGTHRTTVNRWENETAPISKENDFILRTLAAFHLMEEGSVGLADLLGDGALAAVRSRAPAKRPPRLVIERLLARRG